MRLAIPATANYWVNDAVGDPLFVVTAEANARMVKMLSDPAAGKLGEHGPESIEKHGAKDRRCCGRCSAGDDRISL